ncbi:hypothetical protein COEREDRAFT_81288 [Coemansia reversa NRRL 1564]|uniref:Uncharacterized protein n=1 Tax=Coemansia reversa (strain ATCC 12441 / NRRL 1564) TaxID=763665 RepID=A0A2G5BBC0_COERN|nr:hypothetical protein COEREDRAFT_81288 [Coemansia reversa NRRL 1564]|eukprot:PIA16303.1 hypothetical protein COEREDRAFT_81288 [Coemansia reversa NRRL 1564]
MDSELTTTAGAAGLFAAAATITTTEPAPEWLELFDPQTRRVVYANIVRVTPTCGC